MKRTTRKKFTGGGGWKSGNRTYSNKEIIDGIIKGHNFRANSNGNLEVWLPDANEEKSFIIKRKIGRIRNQCSNGIFNYTVKPSGEDYDFVSDTNKGLEQRWKSVKMMDSSKICEKINMDYKFSSGKDHILRITKDPYDNYGNPIETRIVTHKSPNKSHKSPSKSPNKSHKSPSKPHTSPSKPHTSPIKPHKSPNKSNTSPNKSNTSLSKSSKST